MGTETCGLNAGDSVGGGPEGGGHEAEIKTDLRLKHHVPF